MFTDLDFTNRSLNPNVRRVGLFWRPVDGGSPVVWYVIERCGFGWHHPLRLRWDWRADGLPIPLGGLVLPRGTPPGPQGLSCDGRAAMELPVPPAILTPPHLLCFCADLALAPGDPVTEADLNRSACDIAVFGLRRLTVAMRGGEPGPRATPIRFAAERRARW